MTRNLAPFLMPAGYRRLRSTAFPMTLLAVALTGCGAGATGSEGVTDGLGQFSSNGSLGAANPDVDEAPDNVGDQVTGDVDSGVTGTPDAVVGGEDPGAEPSEEMEPVSGGSDESDEPATPDAVDETTSGSTEEPGETGSESASATTALEQIQAHPRLGNLSQLISSSSIGGLLSEENQRLTLFAPSDKAFEQYSAAQRERLLNDSDRVLRLLRHHLVSDVRLSDASIGIVTTASTLEGGTFQIDRIDGSIEIGGYDHSSLTVLETLLVDDVVVHVVDDFFRLPFDFFDPDEGSLGSMLATLDRGMADSLENSKWRGILGNGERHFTVMMPVVDSLSLTDGPIRLADHIVEHEFAQPSGVVLGQYEAASGEPITTAFVDSRHTVNNQDIIEISHGRATNGQAHLLRRPLIQSGVDLSNAPGRDLLAALDTLATGGVQVDGESGFNQSGFDRGIDNAFGATGGQMPTIGGGYDMRRTGARLMAALIRETGQSALYEAADARLTVLVPSYQNDFGTGPEFESGSPGFGDNACGVPPAYRSVVERYATLIGDSQMPLVGTVFTDMESARRFLSDHTLDGAYSASLLMASEGNALVSLSGTAYVLSVERTYNTDANGQQYLSYASDLLGNTTYSHLVSAANGSILGIYKEVVESADPEPATQITCDQYGNPLGPVESALVNDPELSNFETGFLLQGFGGTLDAGENAWTVFAPSNAAFAKAGLTGHDIAESTQRFIVTSGGHSVADLLSMGSVTTNSGATYAVGGSAGAVTVGGFAVTLVGGEDAATKLYRIEGFLE